MNENVQIAVITNATFLVGLVISRLLSHFEHRDTSADVKEIKKMVNGSNPDMNEVKRRLDTLEGK